MRKNARDFLEISKIFAILVAVGHAPRQDSP